MASDAAAIFDEIKGKVIAMPEIRQRAREIADEVAEEAATFAEEIAPVRTGEYRDSIHVVDAPDHEGMPAARVITELRYAAFLEYGTRLTPEFAIFAKTAQHFIEKYGPGEDNGNL